MTFTDEEMRELEIFARQQVEPGGSIELHHDGCPAMVDEVCTCNPVRITVPKEQA